MWLKLELNGIVLYLRITRYQKAAEENWDESWCNIDLSFIFEPVINYRYEDEALLVCEVDDIAILLEKLLNDEIDELVEEEFIEPDFKMIFNPKRDISNDRKYSYVQPGYEMEDIYMEWRIFLWNAYASDNYLSVRLYRDDIEDMLVYLKWVQGRLKRNSPEVQERIKREVFMPMYM